MLKRPPPAKYVHRKGKPKARKAPAALTLISATYDASGPRAILTFDRAVDASGADAGQLRLYDGVTTLRNYVGQNVSDQPTPQSLRIALQELGAAGAGNVSLTVLDENGIVAVDDGGTWDGVTDVVLPFPP
jgi:hypothetical protein